MNHAKSQFKNKKSVFLLCGISHIMKNKGMRDKFWVEGKGEEIEKNKGKKQGKTKHEWNELILC